MFPKYTGDPTMTAWENNKSSVDTSTTRFRRTLVAETAFAPSATLLAIFSVLPETEWYAISTVTEEVESAACVGLSASRRTVVSTAMRPFLRNCRQFIYTSHTGGCVSCV